jgi:FMN phosphatase YigB (HAD superfamily)
VGDSEENDLHGAQNAGLTGLLIDRRQESRHCGPNRIASLEEILARLD